MKARSVVKRTIKLSLSVDEAQILHALLSGVSVSPARGDGEIAVSVKHMLEEMADVPSGMLTEFTFSDLFEGEIVIK